MEEEPADYNCSQSALYATCRNQWKNYATELTAMGAMSPRYTAAYGTAALAEIKAAQLLPDDQSRGTAKEVAFTDLVDIYAPDALLKWKQLRRYIEFAYPKHIKAMLEDAGWKHFEKAGKKDWKEMNQLMERGEAFLANATHVAALTANDGMPPGFVVTYGTAKDGYDDQYSLFMGEGSSQPEGTVTKRAANNAIYRKAMVLSKDAPIALPNMPSRYNKMVFAHQLSLVEGSDPQPGFSKVYPVAAGENLTVNDFLLKETTQVGVTLMTDVGPVFICRNLLAGCAGTGTLLLYNQQENTGMEKLSGDDPQLVITNTSAVDVEVLVKVLTV